MILSLKKINVKIKINNKILILLSLVYLYLPLLIFFFTWTKWWIAILSTFVAIIGCVGIIRDFQYEEIEKITIGILPLIVVTILLLLVGWLSGWSGDCPQAEDWYKHNAVLSDLVERSWPVYYKDAVSPSMLTYYIGQYLVPAVFGKLTSSFRIAEIVMYIWGEIGLFLVVFNLFRVLKAFSAKKQILATVIFLFFNGCLILAQQLYEIFSGIVLSDIRWMIFSDEGVLQYRSNFVDLRWVMPQCLAIWLVITLWWNHRDKINDYVSLMIPACLNGALSFLGLAIIAVVCAVVESFIRNTHMKEWIRKILSVQNILSAFVIGGVLVIYYAGNVFSVKPRNVGFSLQKLDIWLYVSFVLAYFVLHCFVVWKNNRHNGIFIGSIIALFVFPVIKMGYGNDFAMSCSIPGIFIIMICVSEYLLQFKKTVGTGVLVVLLFIGAINPLKEIRSIIIDYIPGEIQDAVSMDILEIYSDLEDENVPISWKYNYYSYNVNENIFIKYIARNPW